MIIYEKQFLLALILTVVAEFFVLLFFRKFFVERLREIKLKDILFFSFIASSLTLPYLWFVLPIFIFDRVIYIIVSEIFAVIVEAVFYWRVLQISFKKTIIISFISNFFSFLIGLLFF